MAETETKGLDNDRVRDLAFFGRVSASVSHELNNVITIINEKSGLLGDLAYGMEHGRDLTPDRLRDIGASLCRQAQRGVDILRRFNRFAHSMDDPAVTFELKALVENLALLCDRFAARKKLELKAELMEEGLNMQGDPFTVQHAVFACLDAAMEALAQGGAITLSVRSAGSEAVVHVSASPVPALLPPEQAMASIHTLARNAGGRLDTTVAEDALVFTLTFPWDAGAGA